MQQHELLSPGFCILCESGAPGLEFWDSNFNLELDTMVYLSGRKYVCETCFTQMAEYWGYEASNQIEHAEKVKADIQAELKALYQHLDEARDLAVAKWNAIEATPVKVRGKPGRPRKNPVEAGDAS